VPLVYKSFQYRIYPTEDQKKFLDQQFGGARFVYNFFLNRRKNEYLNNKKSLSYFDDQKALTELKTQDGYVWMYDINAQTLQASLRNLETAYSKFFKKEAKFPRFHSKKDEECIKYSQNFSVKNNKLKVPKLKSKIKINFHQPLPEKQIALFIRKTPSGKYFASFLCEININPLPISPNSVGVDLGIKSLLVESNGNVVENPKYLKHLESKLIFKQRQLSKKRKGSNKRNKQKIVAARQHEKIANKRKDLLHKVSKRLINENQVIIAENLAVKNMMKNHKLAKAISDVSWGELLCMIEYKAKWYGRTFYQIDRFFPSSKTCNNCQFIVDKLPINIRSWTCPNCKTKLDRDLNAAKNIRDKGLKDLRDLSNKDLSVSQETGASVSGTESDIKQKPEEALLKRLEKSKTKRTQKK
jgi:putative transposase